MGQVGRDMPHKAAIGAAIVLWLSVSTSLTAAEREYIWDLSPLIGDHEVWTAERDWVLARIETIDELADGEFGGPSELADVLDAAYELRARATRLAVFGFLTSDVDTSSERGRLYYDVGTSLEHRALGSVGFLKRRILDLGVDRLRVWLEEEPRLERHRRWLNDILRLEPYALDAEAEEIVESAARWPRLPADLFAPLHGADVGWPTVRLGSGEEMKVDRSTYISRRSSPLRADRLAVARAYFGHLGELEELFGLLYTRRVEADLTLARLRGFDDAIEALWLQRDGMPAGSHLPMIAVARESRETLRRYVELRSRVLGVERAALVDLHAPVPGLPEGIPIPSALETAVAALASLGSEFESTLRVLTGQPWMHLEATPHKARSYAIWPSVAGSPPYFFLSYDGSLDHSRRVAGGLALQAAFASIPPDLTPSTRDDPGIYANGMIYVGDMLHDDYVVSRASGRAERIATLTHSLDFLWQHFFRWVLVSELDVEVQARVLAGEPPSGSAISDLYGRLQREYYGGVSGSMELEATDAAEWMSFSVPFLSYEHQFWPAAVAMAAVIIERTEAGDTRVAERCWRLLGRGEVDRTYQLLESIGIDMASREPYEAVIRRMDALLTALAGELTPRDAG